MTQIIIACATFVSTLLGGTFALRFKDKLHLILGFSAGAVIMVAFADLMPESIDLAGKIITVPNVTAIIAAAFIGYMILDRFVIFHTHDDDHEGHTHRGRLGAGSLSIHSFLDGVAIGLAFQASAAIGAIVATAVLVHDFSDGINTVNLILKNQGNTKNARSWLFVDAVAPVVGVISTLFFTLSESDLGIVLAIFTGFFLYIGASDLLPESHHNHPTHWTTFMTILGAALLFVAIRIASL